MRTWQGGGDFAQVNFALAVADKTAGPFREMIVGPPSSGKTETVRSLDDAADDRLDEISPRRRAAVLVE